MFTSSNCSMISEKLFEKKKSLCVCVYTYIQTERQREKEKKKKSPWIQYTLQNIFLCWDIRTELFLNDNVSLEA